MADLTTDVAIIGAGTAGLNARREVERAGKRWLLIEAGQHGTTCARVGCMPSKLLIAAAEVAHSAHTASTFGIQIDPAAIRVDGPAVLARVQRERDRFVSLVQRDIEALPAEQRLLGKARFIAENELVVGESDRVRADAIVIATGSRPHVPETLAPLGDALFTTDTIFEEKTLPRSLAIFGTGAIGLELGQAFQALGVRVVIYNPKPELGAFGDPEVARRFHAVIARTHELVLGFTAVEVKRAVDACVIRHRDAGGEWHEARFERVLSAAGRRPNLESLQLPAAGLALDERGVPHFDPETMQCGDRAVFIAGDASASGTVLHEAVDEGAIAGANAARFPVRQHSRRRVPLRIGFTSPRMATLGLGFREASQKRAVIGHSSYEDQGRARVIAQTDGYVRVYVDRSTRCLIGAELFGPGVEHTAHLLAWAVGTRTALPELLHMPVYHPTLEEGIRTALRDAAHQLALSEHCPPADRGFGPGV